MKSRSDIGVSSAGSNSFGVTFKVRVVAGPLGVGVGGVEGIEDLVTEGGAGLEVATVAHGSEGEAEEFGGAGVFGVGFDPGEGFAAEVGGGVAD